MSFRITIEALDEGYLLTLNDGKKIAATDIYMVVIKLKAFFGEIDKKQTDKLEMQPVDMIEHLAIASTVEEKQNIPSIPAHIQIISPSGLKLPKFECDFAMMKPYQNILFLEMPDGKVSLEYSGSRYFTTKDLVLKIPYPFPKKYFSTENGWSSSVEVAFKKYRQYLAEQMQVTPKAVSLKQKIELPGDDSKFKPYNINNTRTDYDGNKIEGTLED